MTSIIIRIDIFSLVHISRSCRCHNFVYGNTITSPFHVGLLWWGRWKDRIKRESMKIPHQQRCLLCPYQLPRHELLDYYFPVSQITLPFKLLLSWKTNESNFVVLHFQSSLSLPSQQYFLHVCHVMVSTFSFSPYDGSGLHYFYLHCCSYLKLYICPCTSSF